MKLKSLPPVVTDTLRRGEVGVMPTDTLYGIVGSALRPKTVERIYRLRKRNPKKPMIILISHINDLAVFGIVPDPQIKKALRKIWPGKVSVVLSQNTQRHAFIKKFQYLHRGTRTLAFRLPKPTWLQALLKKTGPLVAPSANFEGAPPARTLAAAKYYFKDKIDFYVDAGRIVSKPSTLIRIENGKIEVLRGGAGKVKTVRQPRV
jgi:L-threonylcarbamoyladenylate synthase